MGSVKCSFEVSLSFLNCAAEKMMPILSHGLLGRLAISAASSHFAASLGTATRSLSTATSELKEAFAAQIPSEQVN